MKKFYFLFMVLSLCSCSVAKNITITKENHKTGVVCHRGFWNCEEAGYSENTIASLAQAQKNGFWGSECDVQLTKDEVVIVNHNDDIEGHKIAQTNWADLQGFKYPNGERRPTLDEYLTQTEKCKTTKLIIEFKSQPTSEKEDILIAKTIEALKEHNLYNPDRIVFISFSLHVCERIAADYPKFTNQYLNGELSPAKLNAKGINGFDYEQMIVSKEMIAKAHLLKMSTNVWTVNEESQMSQLIGWNVDAITTNEPLKLRAILGDKEKKN